MGKIAHISKLMKENSGFHTLWHRNTWWWVNVNNTRWEKTADANSKNSCRQAQCANIHTQNFVYSNLSTMEFLSASAFHSLTKLPRKRKICGICVLLSTTTSSVGNISMINKSWMHSLDLQLKSKMVRGGFPPDHGCFHNAWCVVYLSTASV